MVKPIIPTKYTFDQIERQLITMCHSYEKNFRDNPLSLTTKCAAMFKWHLTCGILDYIRELDVAGQEQFMHDFRNMQYLKMFTDYRDQMRKERKQMLAQGSDV